MMVMSNGFETPCVGWEQSPHQGKTTVLQFLACGLFQNARWCSEGQSPRPKHWAHKVPVTLVLTCRVTFCLCSWVFFFPSAVTIVVVQSLSCVQLSVTPCTAARQVSLSFTISWSLLKLVSWVSDAIQPSHSLPFSSCPQSFSASGSFPTSWLLASGSQCIGASASVLPRNILGWFPLGLTGLIPLQKSSKVFSSTTGSKASILRHSAFFMIQLSHPYMTTGKTIALSLMTVEGPNLYPTRRAWKFITWRLFIIMRSPMLADPSPLGLERWFSG